MRDSPERLNEADFAQKLFNTVEANYADLVDFAGIATRADLEDNSGVTETILNASPLVGQVVQIQVEQALNGTVQPAMLVDYGEAVEQPIGNVVCTGVLTGFFIGHEEMGVTENQFYSSEAIVEEDCIEAEGPVDTAVLVRPWLGVRLELLGYVLPEDTVAPVIEVPVQLIDGVRLAPTDHPLMPDYVVYSHDVMQPEKSVNSQNTLEAAEDQQEIEDLMLARRVLFSRAIDRKMAIAWINGEKTITFEDEDGKHIVHLPDIELYHGTLISFDIEPAEDNTGACQLHAIFKDSGNNNEYTQVALEQIIAGSLASEDSLEQDHVLFGKLQDVFEQAMEGFLDSQPSFLEACDFAAGLCEDLFNRLYLLSKSLLEVRIDQDSAYGIIREVIKGGVLDLEADRDENGYQQLWVGEWYQMRCGLAGLSFSLDAEIDEDAFSINDFNLDLLLEPHDDLARHYDANFLRVSANDVLGARFAELPKGFYN